MSTAAVSVEHIAKRFRVYHERNQTLKAAVMRRRRAVYEDFWALDDVSFEIPQGSTFGLVGDNGSGKSTLLKTLAKILYPDRGAVTTRGRLAALLEVGSGFHPELSGRENVFLNGSILGMSKAEIARKFDAIVDFSGVEQFIDQPVKNYSSGMYVRLGFAVAINVDPEILLVDEVLAVGDSAFQEKCAEKFVDFRREGRTVVVVSHSMPSVRAMCDHVAWLSHGTLVETGPAAGVLDRYGDSNRQDLRTDDRGRVRWGSGEATIDHVEVLTHGVPSSTVTSGDEAVVRISFTAHTPIEQPVFGLALESHDGVYLWANNTRDAEFTLDRIDGSGRIECRIPRLALQPGSFTLMASVVDTSTTHVYDYVRDVAELHVTHGPHTESGGYLALDGRWS
ncbi:ABC transporter ATP-binding protein [Actinotalea sp.]|uniref:ABC transporter ATP-binding protein n=1 Tax=Actinotalea sp. TaxID=1872145 RepID=UPI002C38900B|nr:ABC transporter ATP-binding protein [Actinotalea sp.]HRA51679.1 ABC transporter ATP-binding protein [Actinotalea sp.]